MNIDNPKDYNWIINNGCSYGQLLESTIDQKRFLFDIDTFESKSTPLTIERYLTIEGNVVFIDLHLPASGAVWQSEATIFYVNKLLSIGVPVSQIYVVIEWSDLQRHMVQPSHLYNLKYSNLGKAKLRDIQIYEKDSNSKFQNENPHCSEINSLSDKCIIGGRVDDTYFVNITSTAYTPKNDDDLSFFIQNERKLYDGQSIEFFIQQYYNYIIKTQNFLKYHGINYNFTSMFSFIQGWYFHNNVKKQIYLHDGADQISPYKEDGTITSNRETPTDYIKNNIQTTFPQFNFLFDQIDYNQFWFYNSEKFKYGGLDEWAMDNLGETGYFKRLYSPVYENIQRFRNHPNPLMYILLWNKICKDCAFVKVNENYVDEITTKYWEDYNSDKSTEHGVSISKKYLDLEIEKYNDSV